MACESAAETLSEFVRGGLYAVLGAIAAESGTSGLRGIDPFEGELEIWNVWGHSATWVARWVGILIEVWVRIQEIATHFWACLGLYISQYLEKVTMRRGIVALAGAWTWLSAPSVSAWDEVCGQIEIEQKKALAANPGGEYLLL